MTCLGLSRRTELLFDRMASWKEELTASGPDRSLAPAGYEVVLCRGRKEAQKSSLYDQDCYHETRGDGRILRSSLLLVEGATPGHHE